jgi:hypothetical protein
MNSLSDTCTDPARTFVTDNALFGQRSDGASTTSCCVFAAAGARAARRGKTQRRVETYFLQLVSLYKYTGFENCKLKGQRHLEAFCRGQQAKNQKNRRVGGVVQAQAVSPHSVVDSRTVSYTCTTFFFFFFWYTTPSVGCGGREPQLGGFHQRLEGASRRPAVCGEMLAIRRSGVGDGTIGS